ncbi:hypothetical protein KUTeg_008906 [Tegillarca granosa]|uniref:Sterol regulatory element-binding protein cleavage-activating protein n=1 Tax=Tegillarca granosa TaxID=220873 RepID=A0ABQ9FAI3_TEGGR|nr:hypothetical protein KUTeg_008906 [Tegillarca granosa]
MKSLRDRVTQIYYTHGLFCASHPYAILATYIGEPVGYVQQIIVKAAVSPWQHSRMIPSDAFRVPLSKVFDVIQHIEHFKYQTSDGDISVADICLRVPEVLSTVKAKSVLPEYACLELSPANLWHRDLSKFKNDAEILQMIYGSHRQALETPPYVRDILFGVPWKDSGISRYFIRNQQRTITFGVTIVMKKYDPGFLNSLKKKLENTYPETIKNVNNTKIDYIVHIHYKEVKVFVDYMLLILTYIVLLMYIYFSVRKIEMVKSKWGLALSAVVTVVSSLLMSVSICTVFGLTPTLNGGEIFPYLVILIGLENILVITKSVVSTPVDLEVLEFALFALVGLLSDFFLQIVFFVTVLSVDIRRMEACTVIWISLIIYKVGLVQHITNTTNASMKIQDVTKLEKSVPSDTEVSKHVSHSSKKDNDPKNTQTQFSWKSFDEDAEDIILHKTTELWKELSYKHWPTLFGYYNISLVGRYISILPSVHLSMLISPETAIEMRHPSDKRTSKPHPPQDEPLQDKNNESSQSQAEVNPYYMYSPEDLRQFYPKSQSELVISVCLVLLSFICITYFMVVLYRCMCSRTYGRKVRGGKRQSRHGKYYRQIKPSVPKILRGHLQLRVDTPPVKRRPCVGRNIEDSDADLYAEYHGDQSDSILSEYSVVDTYSSTRHRTSSQTQKPLRNLFGNEPDLSGTIDTNFGNVSQISTNSSVQSTGSGFDFSGRFDQLYQEHKNLTAQTEQSLNDSQMLEAVRSRSWSAGDYPITTEHDAALFDQGFQNNQAPSIWCLTCHEGLIVAGCGNGRIEFWDGSSGSLKCMYGECKIGVTSLCFVGKQVIAGRLDGSVEFLEIETFQNPVHPPATTKPHQKGHTRNFSQQYTTVPSLRKWEEIIHVTQIICIKAHQQSIISLHCEGGRVVSASQDHTMKVFRLQDCLCLYTLHGHTDKITVVYVDKSPPYHVASGAANGSVRLWDLHSGSCVHKVRVHDGAVLALICTSKYVISAGVDDQLCIWDKRTGVITHLLQLDSCGNNCLELLTPNLLGCIYLLDISKGEIIRTVQLGEIDRTAFIHQIKVVANTVIVCDYASEMKVIHFPTVLEKAE